MYSILKKIFLILSMVFLLSNLLLAGEKRVALVIANQDYTNFSHLKSAKASGQIVKSFLEKMGFDVQYYENLTIAKMKKVIKEFNSKLDNNSVALIYYQGLSLMRDNQDYLLMVDSKKVDKNFKSESINLQNLVYKLKSTKLTIAIMDINRNEMETRAVKIYPKNLFLAFSTQVGSINQDSTNFAKFFVRYAKEDLEIEEVFKNVQKEMLKVTNNKQIPTIISSKSNDFFFSKK